MAKTKTSSTLSTDALKPYVQRAMTDPELREDLLAAFVAARSIYGQMSKGRGIKGKKSHKARNRVFLLTGVTLGVLYNPWTGQSTRDWIMEQVSGNNSSGLDELDAEMAADAAAGNGSEGL